MTAATIKPLLAARDTTLFVTKVIAVLHTELAHTYVLL